MALFAFDGSYTENSPPAKGLPVDFLARANTWSAPIVLIPH